MLSSLVFVTGSESHEELPGVLDAIGQPSQLRVTPTLNNYIGNVSDHGISSPTARQGWMQSTEGPKWTHSSATCCPRGRPCYDSCEPMSIATAKKLTTEVRGKSRSPVKSSSGQVMKGEGRQV